MSLLQPDSISECMNHFQNWDNSYCVWKKRCWKPTAPDVSQQRVCTSPVIIIHRISLSEEREVTVSNISTSMNAGSEHEKWRQQWMGNLSTWRPLPLEDLQSKRCMDKAEFEINIVYRGDELPGCKENCICCLSCRKYSSAFRKVMLAISSPWSCPVVQKKGCMEHSSFVLTTEILYGIILLP